MPDWIWVIAFLVGYITLTQWLLPNWVYPPEKASLASNLGAMMPRSRTPGEIATSANERSVINSIPLRGLCFVGTRLCLYRAMKIELSELGSIFCV
jgi:hypothetical protein